MQVTTLLYRLNRIKINAIKIISSKDCSLSSKKLIILRRKDDVISISPISKRQFSDFLLASNPNIHLEAKNNLIPLLYKYVPLLKNKKSSKVARMTGLLIIQQSYFHVISYSPSKTIVTRTTKRLVDYFMNYVMG